MTIKNYEFYQKYRDEFDGYRGVRDMVDYLMSLTMDMPKEDAWQNLRNWFLTDDLEIISDHLNLIKEYLPKDVFEYIQSEFGISQS